MIGVSMWYAKLSTREDSSSALFKVPLRSISYLGSSRERSRSVKIDQDWSRLIKINHVKVPLRSTSYIYPITVSSLYHHCTITVFSPFEILLRYIHINFKILLTLLL